MVEMTGRRSRLGRHLHKREGSEINLVSMIDMMTILVFFLLVHGGFIRLAVLQLNLPSAESQAQNEPPQFDLEITVRESGIEIGDRATGVLNRIENTDAGYDLAQLTVELKRVKEQFPEKEEATLLVEPYISYEVVVAVMDRVRVAEERDAVLDRVNRVELFPEVSVGDAPL
jgi:biopolymer transport protein ExbD